MSLLESNNNSSVAQTESVQPVCGMCAHFQPERALLMLGKIQVETPSYCKLRASAELPSLFKADSTYAKRCIWFIEEVPF